MLIYVMSRYGNLERVREFIDDAVAVGHRITHDWTRGENNGPDDELSQEMCVHHGKLDLEQGVRPAELLVFLADTPEFCGSLIEFGYGLAHDIPAWIVAPWRFSIFWRMPGVEIIETESEARARLGMEGMTICSGEEMDRAIRELDWRGVHF